MYHRVVHRRGLLATAATALAVLFVTAACGSSEYRYVSNSETKAYLKVPDSWTEFNGDTLVEAEARAGGTDLVNPLDSASLLAEKLVDEGIMRPSVQWRLSFDSDANPALEHVILPRNAAPVVDVLVRDLTDPPRLREAANASFLETIFDLHVGLSGGLDPAALQAIATGEAELPAEFKVRRDLRFDDGVRRMRLIATYTGPDEQVYTIDQTGVIDADTERLYVLAIRAGEQEYLENFDVIDEIATSFTVKQDG